MILHGVHGHAMIVKSISCSSSNLSASSCAFQSNKSHLGNVNGSKACQSGIVPATIVTIAVQVNISIILHLPGLRGLGLYSICLGIVISTSDSSVLKLSDISNRFLLTLRFCVLVRYFVGIVLFTSCSYMLRCSGSLSLSVSVSLAFPLWSVVTVSSETSELLPSSWFILSSADSYSSESVTQDDSRSSSFTATYVAAMLSGSMGPTSDGNSVSFISGCPDELISNGPHSPSNSIFRFFSEITPSRCSSSS